MISPWINPLSMSICKGKIGKVEDYGYHWKVLLLWLPVAAMLLSRCALCSGLEWPSFLLCHRGVTWPLCAHIPESVSLKTASPGLCWVSIQVRSSAFLAKQWRGRGSWIKLAWGNLNIILTSRILLIAKFFRQEAKCNQHPCHTHLCVFCYHSPPWPLAYPATCWISH